MGLFRKNDEKVLYLPHPDYLDIGKFKLQKNLKGNQISTQDCQPYKDTYESIIKVRL